MNILYMLSIIMGGILIYLVINLLNKKEKEIPTNEDFVLIFDSDKTKEGAYGLIENIDFSENKVRVEFSSRNRNILRDLKESGKVKNLLKRNFKNQIKSQIIYFDRKLFQDSGLSPFNKVYFAFPQKVQRIPENTKNTIIGKMAMELINNSNIERDTERLYAERLNNMEKVSKETFGGEVFSNLLKQNELFMKNYLSSVRPMEKKDEK